MSLSTIPSCMMSYTLLSSSHIGLRPRSSLYTTLMPQTSCTRFTRTTLPSCTSSSMLPDYSSKGLCRRKVHQDLAPAHLAAPADSAISAPCRQTVKPRTKCRQTLNNYRARRRHPRLRIPHHPWSELSPIPDRAMTTILQLVGSRLTRRVPMRVLRWLQVRLLKSSSVTSLVPLQLSAHNLL